MVKLQWLQINRFRSVKPGTRLTFNPGYNVLLGQNGTGKTTLLNLVAAVIRSDFSQFQDVDFDLQYGLSSDTGTATISVRNEPRLSGLIPALLRGHRQEPLPTDVNRSEPVFTAEVRLESKASGSAVVEIQGSGGTVSVMESGTWSTPLKFESSVNYALPLKIWSALDVVRGRYPSLLELLNVFAERQLQRFDESLDFFAQISRTIVTCLRFGQSYSEHVVQIEGVVALQETLLPLVHKHWGRHQYSITHEHLPFLRDAVLQLGFESAEAFLELLESVDHEVADVMRLGNLRFLFTHHAGWTISEKLLSYGQKRMLAFLCYLATVQSVAVADELVNGLHHRWIQAAIEALGQRQVFLTSQNPLLLDYLTFESPEQVRSTFILCHWEGEGAQARMAWESMTQEAAEDFFDSFKVGFQQVGELLQAKGLW